MLVQLHAQDPSNHKSTTMLWQTEVNDEEQGRKFFASVNDVWEQKKAEGVVPDGWTPMVCNEHYTGFWWAKP